MMTNTFMRFFIGTVAVCAGLAIAAGYASTTKPITAGYTTPLNFELNRGQTNSRVDFMAHGAGYAVFLSRAAASILVQHGSTAIRMRPVGDSFLSRPDALDEQPAKSNYFIGNDPKRWHTNVPMYRRILYRNVYPGVDLIYYGNQRQLEYDLVVAPGADPERITLEFEGVSQAKLDRSGNLLMRTEAGEMRWDSPIAYQEVNGARKPVQCTYVRRQKGELRFAVGAYDKSKALIIDPVLEYSTYLGGSNVDGGSSIAVDREGNVYVTGSTTSIDFPTTEGAFQELYPGW